ncbi:MAG: class I SAM-dependent RNA methyltransferase [Gemmatimonadales bacterium]
MEGLVAAELSALGVTVTATEPGGCSATGSLLDVARLNMQLRTASRILVRRAQFSARALGELERKAGLLPWKEWLPPTLPVVLRVSCKKSRLYHQRAVAERIGNAIRGSTGLESTTSAGDIESDGDADPEGEAPHQLVVVRFYRDECTISVDSSGELLHRRGWRLATAKAPLRETLAAALLAASGWDPVTPLLDPFCGSGTIPIEAALQARRILPNLERRFAVERWPGFDAATLTALRVAARAETLPVAPAMILGADRDAGAIAAARANAVRAGVAADIEWREAAVSALDPPQGRVGNVVTNPPYGLRIGDARDLRNLFARLGTVARERLAGWQITLLLGDTPLERATGLAFRSVLTTRNGGLHVRLLSGRVPESP